MSMLYLIYFIVQFCRFSQCIFVYSPSTQTNFKTYAVISNEIMLNPYIREDRCIFLDIFALSENLRLCILVHDLLKHRMIKNTTILLPTQGFATDEFYHLKNFNLTFARGYVVENPYTSSLSGYIHNKSFFGRVQIAKKTYYIEPLQKFKLISRTYQKPNEKAVFYEAEDIDNNFIVDENDFVQNFHLKADELAHIGNNMEHIALWKRRSCAILVAVDYTFFKEIAESDTNLAIMLVINSFLFVNNIYETTDFDNDQEPDNIGFIIKYILILHSVEFHNQYFKHETAHAVDATKYLDMFAKYNAQSFFEACFEVLLTAQPFKGNFLSISYVAPHQHLRTVNKYSESGICAKPPLNKLVISNYIDYGDYVPVLMMNLALIHEIGHIFGAVHDDGICSGFAMSSKLIYIGDHKTYFTFSNCSKVSMLRAIKQSSSCFEMWSSDSQCGNGITEAGEQCDCGLSYDCNNVNFCCIAHDGKDKPCEIDRKSGFDCMPTQGFCCNKECQYNDLSSFHINCKNERLKCPCEERNSFCTCGHSGLCIEDHCHSQECVYSGLLECTCSLSDKIHCETCCVTSNGECLPLSEIKEVYINGSNPLLRSLKHVQFISYGNLTHKIWKKNELCLSFGKTGYCERGVCDLVAPQLIMNKMTEAVESLKPYYQEDMRKRSELPSKKARDVAQVPELPEEESNDKSIPFLPDSSAVSYICNYYKLIFYKNYLYMLLFYIVFL